MELLFHRTEKAPLISLFSFDKLTQKRNRKMALARRHVFVSNQDLCKFFSMTGSSFPLSGRALSQRFLY